MLISRDWLNEYFEGSLPKAADLARAITMNAFEIESVEESGGDAVLDVKVLPNRAHDCLCHRGMAREVGTVIGMKPSIPGKPELAYAGPSTVDLDVSTPLCNRAMFLRVSGVKIGPSPEWLKEKLAKLGQRPINNLVDITNYVMFETGQPMHAFDLGKMKESGGRKRFGLKSVPAGTKMRILGGKEYELPEGALVFTDENAGGSILDIAGMKGGDLAEIGETTTDVALSAANFDQAYIRRYSKAIGVQTDATKRSENGIAPELAEEGLLLAAKLVLELAAENGRAEEPVDHYPRRRKPYKVGVSLEEANRRLGADIGEAEFESILGRTGWDWEKVEPRERIVALAKELVGKTYKLGASVSFDAPDLFDCSSFTAYLYAQAGLSVPRISVDQYASGEPVGMEDLKPGDLVFSNSGDGTIHFETKEWMPGTAVPEGVDHVGVWLGGGEVAHASRRNGSGSVSVERLSDAKAFANVVGARRVRGADGARYVVTAPAERLDLRIKEDVIEDVGRLYGYDRIPLRKPEAASTAPVNRFVHYAQAARDALVSEGFCESRTYALVPKGEIELASPFASDKSWLRADLAAAMRASLETNARHADLLGLDDIREFEIGTVFGKDGEHVSLCIGVRNVKKDKTPESEKAAIALSKAALALGTKIEPKEASPGIIEIDLDEVVGKLPIPSAYDFHAAAPAVKYQSISAYPFVLRDIAVWVPEGETAEAVLEAVRGNAGSLLAKIRLFDTFTKEFPEGRRTSYAFRLVFQSHEKTLSDDEVNVIMSKVTGTLDAKPGWQVR